MKRMLRRKLLDKFKGCWRKIKLQIKNLKNRQLQRIKNCWKRYWNWFVKLYKWMKEGLWGLILFFLIVCSTFLILIFPIEIVIKATGLSLELIGIALSIKSVFDIRHFFKQSPLRTLLCNWIFEAPLKPENPNKNIYCHIKAESKSSGDSSCMNFMQHNPDRPIENQIATILHNIEKINKELSIQGQAISNQKKIFEQYKEEKDKQEKDKHEDVNRKMEEAHTGNYMPILVGLVLVACGSTISTLAPEIFSLLTPT